MARMHPGPAQHQGVPGVHAMIDGRGQADRSGRGEVPARDRAGVDDVLGTLREEGGVTCKDTPTL